MNEANDQGNGKGRSAVVSGARGPGKGYLLTGPTRGSVRAGVTMHPHGNAGAVQRSVQHAVSQSGCGPDVRSAWVIQSNTLSR